MLRRSGGRPAGFDENSTDATGYCSPLSGWPVSISNSSSLMYGVPNLEAWNIVVFQGLHASSGATRLAIYLGVVLAELPVYLAAALALWALVARRDVRMACAIAIACLLGHYVEVLCNQFAYHDRPFAAGYGSALIKHSANNSMPSSHVTFVWTLAALYGMKKHWRLAAVFGCLGLVLAWARIFTGLHWPLDMAGSAATALASSFLAISLVRAGWHMARRARGVQEVGGQARAVNPPSRERRR
ncbi:hypothetical protein [Achromobacter aloeverae]